MPATEQLRLPAFLALFLVPGALMTLALSWSHRSSKPRVPAYRGAAGRYPRSSSCRSSSASSSGPAAATLSASGRSFLSPAAAVPRLAWLVPAPHRRRVRRLRPVDGARADRHRCLFGWLPDWFVRPIDLDRARRLQPRGVARDARRLFRPQRLRGPIVEELYFRGYLLPRMEWMGRWAPLVNVSLFSLYHFWSPWQILGRILGLARRSMPCAGRRTSTSAWSSTARETPWGSPCVGPGPRPRLTPCSRRRYTGAPYRPLAPGRAYCGHANRVVPSTQTVRGAGDRFSIDATGNEGEE